MQEAIGEDGFPRLDIVVPMVAREKKAEEGSSYYPRVSNAESCPRALGMAGRGIEPRDHHGRMAVLFDDGSIHEDATCRWLDESPFKVIMRQQALNVCEIPGAPTTIRKCGVCGQEVPLNVLHGHIDGVITFDDDPREVETWEDPILKEPILFEHKSIGDYGFENLDKEFPIGYVQQCCAYLIGLAKLGFEGINKAILVFKNKNTSAYRQVNIIYDADRDWARVEATWNGRVEILDGCVKRLVDLHVEVEKSLLPGANLPARPYDYDHWKCQHCRFIEPCWANYAAEVKQRREKEVIAESDEIYGLIQDLYRLRAESKEKETETKEARGKLNRLLAERDIKSGVAGNLKFGLSAFTKDGIDENLIPEATRALATRAKVISYVKITEVK
jgi:hypothetical protein